MFSIQLPILAKLPKVQVAKCTLQTQSDHASVTLNVVGQSRHVWLDARTVLLCTRFGLKHNFYLEITGNVCCSSGSPVHKCGLGSTIVLASSFKRKKNFDVICVFFSYYIDVQHYLHSSDGLH